MSKKKHKKKRLIHSDLGTWVFNADYRMWALAGQPFTVFEGGTPDTTGRFYLRRESPMSLFTMFEREQAPNITPLTSTTIGAALDEAGQLVAEYWMQRRVDKENAT